MNPHRGLHHVVAVDGNKLNIPLDKAGKKRLTDFVQKESAAFNASRYQSTSNSSSYLLHYPPDFLFHSELQTTNYVQQERIYILVVFDHALRIPTPL